MDAAGMKWWGWGDPHRTASLEALPGLRTFLAEEIGPLADDPFPVPDPASIRMPPVRLSAGDREALRDVAGDDLAGDDPVRLRHAFGRSYRDLVRYRLGVVPSAPDLVAFPRTEDRIERILAVCVERGVAVVPFGGGTSVVGGVEVVDPRPHVALDLRRMDRVLAVDPVSLTATAEAGIPGPALESALGARGLTLGHFPQSFEFSTLGGWIAARSTGAFSNRYGKIEDLVVALRLVAPTRTVDLRGRPRHAMGGDLLALAIGSEGTLGVISRATVRVHRAPAVRRFASVLFHRFSEGLDALRAMAQDAVPPAMAYLEDEDETRISIAAAGGESPLQRAVLRARGLEERASILFLGHEGATDVVRGGLRVARRYCRGGAFVGPRPADRWYARRYEAPYLRDALIDGRILVDTVETAALWADVERVHRAAKEAVRNAFAAQGVRGWVGCHVSHIYPEGASLYFTFLAPMVRGEELAQYDAVKEAVTRAILAAGGHLSHHHGIGSEHARYFQEAVGDEPARLLADLKRSFDPTGIMNPGKIIPVSA